MFSKYLDQMTAIRQSLINLVDDVQNHKDEVFYNVELALIVEDFNNLNILLNDDLRIYEDRALPYLDLRLLRHILNKEGINEANKLVNQWYDYTHNLLSYYVSLDCSKSVLYLEYCLYVFNNSLRALVLINQFYYDKKLNLAA